MNKVSIIAGVVSIVVSLAGFFLAVKSELRKHTESLIKQRIEEEKRHSRNEGRLLMLEERFANAESYLMRRLDELTRSISELYDIIIEQIKD